MYWQKKLNKSNLDEAVEKLIKEIFYENHENYSYRRIDWNESG